MTMKKLMLFLYSSLLFTGLCTLTSCNPDDPTNEKKEFVIDPAMMISIRPDAAYFTQANRQCISYLPSQHLSAIEIVQLATVLRYRNDSIFGHDSDGTRGFIDEQRDTSASHPCLKMFGTDIISQFGEYVPEFIEGWDVIIEHRYMDGEYMHIDTIAYVPNSVIREAKTLIKSAIENQDIEAVYQIFNEAFTFRPVTGSEWRELKSNGLN